MNRFDVRVSPATKRLNITDCIFLHVILLDDKKRAPHEWVERVGCEITPRLGNELPSPNAPDWRTDILAGPQHVARDWAKFCDQQWGKPLVKTDNCMIWKIAAPH